MLCANVVCSAAQTFPGGTGTSDSVLWKFGTFANQQQRAGTWIPGQSKQNLEYCLYPLSSLSDSNSVNLTRLTTPIRKVFKGDDTKDHPLVRCVYLLFLPLQRILISFVLPASAPNENEYLSLSCGFLTPQLR